jgi:MbtH protein
VAEDQEDTRRYKVVVNLEQQYSIWLADKRNPAGWTDEGTVGSKAECLAHIGRVWVDMRPASLRTRMDETSRAP